MFKKILSTVGIGGTKIDTVLDHETLQAGETVTGRVFIKGGKTDQLIQYLTIYTMTQIDDEVFTICETPVDENIQVRSNQEFDLSFQFVLPEFTPPTFEYCRHWLYTDAEIKRAKDSSDRDYIEVLPHFSAQNTFEALQEIGFELHKIEVIEAHPQMESELPLIQELEFRPQTGDFYGRLDEVEVIFLPRQDSIDLFIEVDRRSGLVSEWMDTDERRVHLRIGMQEAHQKAQLKSILYDAIAEFAR